MPRELCDPVPPNMRPWGKQISPFNCQSLFPLPGEAGGETDGVGEVYFRRPWGKIKNYRLEYFSFVRIYSLSNLPRYRWWLLAGASGGVVLAFSFITLNWEIILRFSLLKFTSKCFIWRNQTLEIHSTKVNYQVSKINMKRIRPVADKTNKSEISRHQTNDNFIVDSAAAVLVKPDSR